MAPDLYNDWLLFLGTAFGLLAAAWAVVKRCRRWTRRVGETVEEWSVWTKHFGGHPATELHNIVTDLAAGIDIIELRQEILSRKLRVGIYVCDGTTGDCIYASDYLAEIFGVPQTAMLGRGWLTQVSDREQADKAWTFCVQRRITYRDTYTVTHAQTGNSSRCRTEAYYVGSDGGRYVGYVEVILT